MASMPAAQAENTGTPHARVPAPRPHARSVQDVGLRTPAPQAAVLPPAPGVRGALPEPVVLAAATCHLCGGHGLRCTLLPDVNAITGVRSLDWSVCLDCLAAHLLCA